MNLPVISKKFTQKNASMLVKKRCKVLAITVVENEVILGQSNTFQKKKIRIFHLGGEKYKFLLLFLI